jgi:hypothetical protein
MLGSDGVGAQRMAVCLTESALWALLAPWLSH